MSEVRHTRRREANDVAGMWPSILVSIVVPEIVHPEDVNALRKTTTSGRAQSVVAFYARPDGRIASSRAMAKRIEEVMLHFRVVPLNHP